MFGNTETGAFYDAKIGITKPRLDAGIPKMKQIQPRKSATIMNSASAQMSCVDVVAAIDAKTIKTKPKHINLTNFKSTKARDESILKTDDRWYNNQLENTKEEREAELNARATQYKNKPIYF